MLYFALLLPCLRWWGFGASCWGGILGQYRIRQFSIRRGEEIAVELEGPASTRRQAMLDAEAIEWNRKLGRGLPWN